jgi:hypothetical protein
LNEYSSQIVEKQVLYHNNILLVKFNLISLIKITAMRTFNQIVTYFDLSKSLKRTTRTVDLTKEKTGPPAANQVVPQYIALAIGIVVQPFLQTYLQSHQWADLQLIIGRTVFGLIVAIAIFPAVYKRSWDPGNPIFVQLCSIFSAGLGWQTLFAAGSASFHP